MKYWNKLCGFLVIFFLSTSFSAAQNVKYFLTKPLNKSLILTITTFSNKKTNENIISPSSLNIVSKNYYTQHMGFVCKKELALEKIINIPLRIRLGSLQQCNYLEGKR